MATLYISEFTEPSIIQGGLNPVVKQPFVAEQTVAIGGSSTPSNAFNAKTGIVRIHTDAICSIEFGTAPVAEATNARMAAGTTEYFEVPLGQSFKVAVITNS